MEKINQAVLGKVREEAQTIISEAEEKAREENEKAKRQREARFNEERSMLRGKAEEEAARLLAQASIKARQQLSSAKANVIAKITEAARKELAQVSSDETHLLGLIREAMNGLGVDKGRIYVSSKDIGAAENLLAADKELAARVLEVKESNFLGGVIAEDAHGKLRIDNTYETRLETLLPKLLPEISKDLFLAP
jgi:vacuolar-type H+-ATPase subunit E/Vma4